MAWLHAVVDVPAPEHDTAASFWGGVLGWPAGAPWPAHPELCSFEPPRGTPYVHLQTIEGPARVHIDLESDDPDATVKAAEELGAESAGRHDRWRTLRSPGGLPFCVLDRIGDRDAPRPMTWPAGHRARMVQVCIDSPPAAHDREVAFWRDLLPGRWVGSQAPEFAGKWHDDGSPLQLLFQRLDENDGPVRAHLDHGTDDVPAEARRLIELGAHDIGPGRGWHVLRDPAGQSFCVTGNSPEQVRTRDLG